MIPLCGSRLETLEFGRIRTTLLAAAWETIVWLNIIYIEEKGTILARPLAPAALSVMVNFNLLTICKENNIIYIFVLGPFLSHLINEEIDLNFGRKER